MNLSTGIRDFSYKRHSLAKRVLYSSLALLGLPLLVHTLFLYHQEYEDNLQGAFSSLEDFSSGMVLFLEQRIRYQHSLIDALANDSPLLQKKILGDLGLGDLLSVSWKDGKPVCGEGVCCSCLQEAARQSEFAFIDPSASEKKIYVGQKDPGSDSLLMITNPANKFLKTLFLFGDVGYPTRVSLSDSKGSVLLSTDPLLEGTSLAWTQVPQAKHGWYFETSQGKYLAVKRPLTGTDYILIADVKEDLIRNLQIKTFVFRIGTFLLATLVFGGGILFWITQRFSRPFSSFSSCMRSVSEGHAQKRFQPDSMGFEINDLGLQFNQMLDTMQAHVEDAQRERLAKERLAEELRIGHAIQASMLPDSLPEIPSLEVAAGYLPAKEVSGDFYDLFVLEDGRLFIVMADAADKGISACLYSLSFRSMLRASAIAEQDLALLVQAANRLLMRDTASSHLFITAWMALFDPSTRELLYCSQGHPPAYLCTAQGEVRELSAGGLALGIEEVVPRVERLVLSPKDLVLLYTDGVIEAHDLRAKLYTSSRLEAFLRAHYSSTAQEVIDKLLEDIREFCSGAPLADDLTLLAFSSQVGASPQTS